MLHNNTKNINKRQCALYRMTHVECSECYSHREVVYRERQGFLDLWRMDDDLCTTCTAYSDLGFAKRHQSSQSGQAACIHQVASMVQDVRIDSQGPYLSRGHVRG